MATSEILGLFATPEQYQAQQLANERAQAGLIANMSPIQLANYGAAMGGQQIGRIVGNLFGVQDPQLQLITQRQRILQSVDPSNPQALLQAAQRANQMGDQQLALQLTDFANRQASEIAQTQQRIAAASREREQAIPADVAKARELGVLTAALAALEQTPPGAPERDQQINMLKTQIAALERPEKVTPDMSNAMALADLVNTDRNSKQWKNAYKTELTRLTTKAENEKKSAFAQQLEDAGYIPGSPAYVSMMDKFLNKELAAKGGADKKSAFAQQLEDAGYIPGSPQYVSMMDKFLAKELADKADKDQITTVGETVSGNKEGLPAGLKVYTNKTNKTQYVLRDGKEVPYYGAVEPQGKTTVEVKNVMPGQGKEGLKGVSSFRNEVIQTIKPFRDTVTATDNAITNINDALKTNNFVSFNAARVQLAKALGDSTLSRRDIEQAGGDPSLIGGFFDATSTLFTGTPSVETQKKILSTLKAIRKVARDKATNELDRQRKLGVRAGYTNEDVNLALDFPEFKGMGSSGGGDKTPSKKTVPFSALPK
jgi:hypothetical protein